MAQDLGCLTILENSFVNFVYPFRFESDHYQSIIKSLSAQKELWETKDLSEVSDYVLSPVAKYLNIDGQQKEQATANFFKSTDRLNCDLKFWTYSEDEEETPPCAWKLKVDRKQLEAFNFTFDSHDPLSLGLFRMGIGFLVFKISPCVKTLEHWLNLIHYFRFINRGRTVRICPIRNPDDNPPFDSDNDQDLKSIIDREILAGFKAEEIFLPGKMLTFFALFCGNVNLDNKDYESEILYRLTKFFRVDQIINPHDRDLDFSQEKDNVLPYVKNQYFLFSLEGGGFYSCHTPDSIFFRETLPQHLQDQYFLLFLLALHQRFALIHLSEQVAECWKISEDKKDIEQNMKTFQKIRDQLLLFTARGHFLQVMQQDNHHRCYCKWREMFQLDALYDEVNKEVQDMHEYSMMQYLRWQNEQERLRDRQLQNSVYHVSASLGAGAIVASTSALLFNDDSTPLLNFAIAFMLSSWIALSVFLLMNGRSALSSIRSLFKLLMR